MLRRYAGGEEDIAGENADVDAEADADAKMITGNAAKGKKKKGAAMLCWKRGAKTLDKGLAERSWL